MKPSAISLETRQARNGPPEDRTGSPVGLMGRIASAEPIQFGGHGRDTTRLGIEISIGKKSSMKSEKKLMQESAESVPPTGKKPKRFTGEEQIGMRERLQELEADARRGARAARGEL